MSHPNFHQPIDSAGRSVPTLRDSGDRTQVTTTDGNTTAATALPTASQLVFIRATATCYINFGTSGVAAVADETSQLFIQGETIQPVPPGATHYAVIRIGATDATVQVAKAI